MDEEELNRINTERRGHFIGECKKVNAKTYNTRWDWKSADNRIGQIMICDENGDAVAMWEESREQLQFLVDEWDFGPKQYLAIGITHHHRIIGVGNGVFGIAWMGRDDNMFQMIFFDQSALLPDETDTLAELEELDGLDLMGD